MVLPERSSSVNFMFGKTLTVEKMRSDMGDFSGCKTPSKFAARIGQCFSTTIQGHRDAPDRESTSRLRHCVVEEVASAYENFPHSDGNGLISRVEMERLLQSLPNKNLRTIANTSVIQIRYGGAKGILVAWDSSVIREVSGSRGYFGQRYDILLRKSMIKFDALFRFVEVCRCVDFSVVILF
jgi:RNA-dependent RNA polymerase